MDEADVLAVINPDALISEILNVAVDYDAVMAPLVSSLIKSSLTSLLLTLSGLVAVSCIAVRISRGRGRIVHPSHRLDPFGEAGLHGPGGGDRERGVNPELTRLQLILQLSGR